MGYIPGPYQRRFSRHGPALALLAVAGWQWMAQQNFIHRAKRRMLTRVFGSVMPVLVLWGQNLMFYGAYVQFHLGRGTAAYVVFQPRALVNAVAYLDGRGESAIVLTCEDMGNLVAA